MSLWVCPKCRIVTAPEHGPCPHCGTPTEYARVVDYMPNVQVQSDLAARDAALRACQESSDRPVREALRFMLTKYPDDLTVVISRRQAEQLAAIVTCADVADAALTRTVQALRELEKDWQAEARRPTPQGRTRAIAYETCLTALAAVIAGIPQR